MRFLFLGIGVATVMRHVRNATPDTIVPSSAAPAGQLPPLGLRILLAANEPSVHSDSVAGRVPTKVGDATRVV